MINNFGTYVRIGFLFNLLKLTYVEFQWNKRISIRTEVLDGKTCQRKNKVCGTYVRIDFLFYLLNLHMHEISIKKQKNQKEQTLAHFVWIISLVTGRNARQNRQLTETLTNIKTKPSFILRIEFKVELQKEMLRSVQWLLRKFKFKSRCLQGRFLYRS